MSAAMTTTQPLTGPRTENVLKLRDGRILGYAEYGAADGRPLFMFHGFPGSRLEFAPGHEAALRRGVRLIAPDRPGFGLSTYLPRRRIFDWPGDVAELADALGIERFGVAGLSGGGPYAAVCASRLPERVTVAGIVAGVGPLDRPGATDGMTPLNRLLFGVQRRLPPAGRALIWAMGMVSARLGERSIERLMRALPEADRRVLQRPEVRSAFMSDAREAFRQGARGAAHENGLFVRPWGFRLEEIRVPVLLWQGEQDRNVPTEHGRYQAQAIPGCRATFYPDEGHMFVYDRMDEILGALTG